MEGAGYLLVIFRCINVLKGEKQNHRLGLHKRGGTQDWSGGKGMADSHFSSHPVHRTQHGRNLNEQVSAEMDSLTVTLKSQPHPSLYEWSLESGATLIASVFTAGRWELSEGPPVMRQRRSNVTAGCPNTTTAISQQAVQ